MTELNYISLITAAILSMVIGIAWYSPSLMGSKWMKLVGLTEEDMKKSANPVMILKSFIVAIVTAYSLAYFINLTGSKDLIGGLKIGLWIWVGFIATTGFINTMYSKRDWQLFYIDYGYQLISILSMSAVLSILR